MMVKVNKKDMDMALTGTGTPKQAKASDFRKNLQIT